MHNLSVREIAQSLRRGDFSSEEITRTCLDRIHENSDLNAFISIDEKGALDQARAADKRLKNGDQSLLAGVPLAHKDIFCTRGLLTTCGSRMLENFVAPYSATIVTKLEEAGVVTLGKTNMDEFAMGSSNETSYFGVVKNPWNQNCVPGGSSGGSAAAVAARLCPLATGTDTGGSIRQPAALCGITGIKPSYGRVSRYGMVAFASSLDQGGAFARSAQDLAPVLSCIAGFDEKDSTSVNQPVPDYAIELNNPLKGLVVGLPKEYFGEGLENEVAININEAIRQIENLGARIVDVSLPNSKLGIPCYYVIAPAEASSNLSRFDGVRYGHRSSDHTDLVDMYKKSRAEGFGDEVKRRIMIGTYVLSSGYYDAYYVKAQRLRRLIADDFNNAFKICDVIMGPTTPGTAFEFGAKSDDPVAMYLNDIYTNAANLAGLPGISLPAGFDTAGKPVGLQIIGKYMHESILLNVAHKYQTVTDWHLKIPGGY